MKLWHAILQQRWPLMLGLVIYGGILWQNIPLVWLQNVYQHLGAIIYDVRINYALERSKIALADSPVVIVDIDDRSLHEMGRWPWPRKTIAQLVDKLFAQGVLVVGFDVQFSEPEENAVKVFLQHETVQALIEPESLEVLQQSADLIDGDHELASSFEQGDVVLGFSFHNQSFEPSGLLPAPIATLSPAVLSRIGLKRYSNYSANIPVLQSSALTAGFINAGFDNDGILRRTPLVVMHDGQVYGSLALNMANAFFLGEHIDLNIVKYKDHFGLSSIRLSNLSIATDVNGNVLIPFKGAPFSLPYVSASDVLLEKSLPSLAQKAVIIGTTATGLHDLKATPISSNFPGVEVHATILHDLLKVMEGQNDGQLVDAQFPSSPDWGEGAVFIILLAMSLVVVFFPWMGPVLLIVSAIVLMLLLVSLDFYLFKYQRIALDMSRPELLLFLITIMNLAQGFIVQTRKRLQIKHMFGQYVPPAYVEQLVHSNQLLSLEGESRQMTVLFADIRSFTTISESLSATRLKQLLNTFFDPMTEIIFTHEGTIDKYVGDMIMAFWGAPLVDGRHADHAIAAALQMLEQVENMQPKLQALGFPEVRIGVGLNTGMMNVGDMGSKFRRAYTVLGDAVNLGSRLEGLTKFYGVSLLIGEETFAQQSLFLCRRLDRVKVKGKDQAIQVYQPLCALSKASEDLQLEVTQYHQALDYYLARRWDLAQSLFSQLRQAHTDVYIYELYLNRIEQLRAQTLPNDWDGVFVRTEK